MFRVFPAPAGINRQGEPAPQEDTRVPRASGDKPLKSIAGRRHVTCSPRQRG
ncbi:hypothetical protein HLX14_001623 [Escherichia coli]|nr:hypothetical protein [Escherichia coli]HAX7063992.1 hypothetical protein [Escherichia coli]